MKSALVFLIVTLVAVASAMPADEAAAVGGKWTREQVNEHLNNVIPSYVTCINSRCRISCLQGGAVAGYCAAGACNCVVPGPPGV